MRVAIQDVDGHNYPNLALMRISAWHKARGDTVEWFTPLCQYDRVYASKIFTFTPDDPYLPPDTIRGGTGYDITSNLPAEIEATPPDYTIYPQFDAAYGFLTRGCPNKCPWCVVPRKEGGVRPVADITDIICTNTGIRRHALLMDNNFLAAPRDFVIRQLVEMVANRVEVDFNQALDARLIDDQIARHLAAVKFRPYIRVSCDTDAAIAPVVAAMKRLRASGYKRDFFCYILAKPGEVESALNRIEAITRTDRRASPFVMPYRDLDSSESEIPRELRRLARWCNMAATRKSIPFKDYKY